MASKYSHLNTTDIDELENLPMDDLVDWYLDKMSRYNYDFSNDDDPINCGQCHERLPDYTRMRKKAGRVLDPECFKSEVEKRWNLESAFSRRYLSLVIKMDEYLASKA